MLPLHLIKQSCNDRKNLFSLLIQLMTKMKKELLFLIRSAICAIQGCTNLVSDQEGKAPSEETSMRMFSSWHPNLVRFQIIASKLGCGNTDTMGEVLRSVT